MFHTLEGRDAIHRDFRDPEGFGGGLSTQGDDVTICSPLRLSCSFLVNLCYLDDFFGKVQLFLTILMVTLHMKLLYMAFSVFVGYSFVSPREGFAYLPGLHPDNGM